MRDVTGRHDTGTGEALPLVVAVADADAVTDGEPLGEVLGEPLGDALAVALGLGDGAKKNSRDAVVRLDAPWYPTPRTPFNVVP